MCACGASVGASTRTNNCSLNANNMQFIFHIDSKIYANRMLNADRIECELSRLFVAINDGEKNVEENDMSIRVGVSHFLFVVDSLLCRLEWMTKIKEKFLLVETESSNRQTFFFFCRQMWLHFPFVCSSICACARWFETAAKDAQNAFRILQFHVCWH